MWTACMLLFFGCNSTSYYYRSGIQADRNTSDNQVGACFAADTLVMMADGSHKKIIDIKVGETVKSYDVKSGQIMDTEVIRIRHGFTGYYYVINGGLKVSPPHPFCTPDNKWVRIEDLKVGQAVRVSSSISKISSIEHIIDGQQIYNIFVKDNHNFFVSGDGKDFFLVKEWR